MAAEYTMYPYSDEDEGRIVVHSEDGDVIMVVDDTDGETITVMKPEGARALARSLTVTSFDAEGSSVRDMEAEPAPADVTTHAVPYSAHRGAVYIAAQTLAGPGATITETLAVAGFLAGD